MSATLPIPFAVGSEVWRARITNAPFYVPCPSCVGTLKHTIILGNGETHVVWCDDCSAHYAYDYDFSMSEGRVPPGQYQRYQTRAEVEKVTLTSVDVRGDEITYHTSGNGYAYVADLFADEAAARLHAETVLKPKAEKQDEENFNRHVFHARSDQARAKQAGSAASWRNARIKAVEELARIDRRIERLKAGGSK